MAVISWASRSRSKVQNGPEGIRFPGRETPMTVPSGLAGGATRW